MRNPEMNGGRLVEEGAKLRTIGKYHLIASLGQGGMAKVYLALLAGPAGFNKLLVIKVLRDDVLSGADEGIRMFWDEARLAARLVHPNIVHTFEVGEADGRYFLAMEYLEGQTYREVQTRARANGGFPLAEDIRILSEVARGLHYSHELKGFNGEPLGVVHRDVSPQNVFLTYDGQVKLLDFGIAKTTDAEHLTQVGVIKGKLDYIAPEQLKGENIDGRADVFALGAMLWEAITGQRFAGGRKVTDVTKVHLRLSGGEPKLRDVKPDVPEELAQIVDRAIAIDYEARFADAAAFADALDGYLASIGSKPNGKSLAAVMAPLFEQERQAMHKLVDEQVRLTKSGVVQLAEHTGELPQLGKAQQNSTSGVYLGDPTDTSGHNVSTPNDTSSGARGASSRSRGLLVGGFLAIAAASVGLYQVMGKPDSQLGAPPPVATSAQPAGPAAVATAPSAASPTAAPTEENPAEATVTLNIKVEPAHAQVTMDGAPIAAPFSGEFRKSSSMHHVEASADGYRTFKRLVTFEEDRALEIVLERNPQPQVARRPGRNEPERKAEPQAPREEPKAAVAAPVAPPAEKTPPLEGAIKSRVKRGDIDLSDPYSNN